MPAATRADVDRVNTAVTGLGEELDDLKQLFDSLRSGTGLAPATTPASAPAAAAPGATNWKPILILAGVGLVLFFLLKGR